MNKQRRNRITKVVVQLEMLKDKIENDDFNAELASISSEVSDILFDEELAYDSMPDNLKESIRACESEDAIEYLKETENNLVEAETSDEVEDIMYAINEAIDNLSEIM